MGVCYMARAQNVTRQPETPIIWTVANNGAFIRMPVEHSLPIFNRHEFHYGTYVRWRCTSRDFPRSPHHTVISADTDRTMTARGFMSRYSKRVPRDIGERKAEANLEILRNHVRKIVICSDNAIIVTRSWRPVTSGSLEISRRCVWITKM